jgi:hypothetical protein
MGGAFVLRAGASLLAAGAFVGADSYVLQHPKNAAAPLQPTSAEDAALRSPALTATPHGSGAPRATATPRGTKPPRITLQPGVRATELPGVAYTHVS